MKNIEGHYEARVLSVAVAAVDMEQAIRRIALELEARRKGYICMAGVHGIMEAERDRELASIFDGSRITLPDGMPTVWVGRLQGHRRMQRVAGPDLMLEVFRRKEFARYTHFLYGGDAGVADELRERFQRKFPWARIIGTYTPPFRELNSEEEQDLRERVRTLKPDIIWVGISTPKQERFMYRYLPMLDTTLMFGVGAAYDFHSGRLKDSPQWVKTVGMQWFHRLLQDPRRLWKRYLHNNSTFLWHIGLQLCGIKVHDMSTTIESLKNVEDVGPLSMRHANSSRTAVAVQLER